MENAVTKMLLTAPELTAARDFLRQADMLVDGVRSLFFNIGPAARLKDIEGRLQDEVQDAMGGGDEIGLSPLF